MSIEALKKASRALVTGGGNYVKHGKYQFLIKKVVCEKKTNGEMFIVELKVNKAQKTQPDVEPNVQGSSCSIAYNLDKHLASAGNVKAFVLGATGEADPGENEDKIAEFFEALKEIVSDAQPLRGWLVEAETFNGTIKSGANAGKAIVKLKWFPVAGQAEKDIAARRAELDKEDGKKAA